MSLGSDVLKHGKGLGLPPTKSPLTQPYRNRSSRDLIIEVLKDAQNKRLTTSQIARRADLSWDTVAKAMKDLMLLGQVEGERVGNAVYFRIKIVPKEV